jgi:ActR/RegA family two-component response regulator
MQEKKALLLDQDPDFCLLLNDYLFRKGFKCYYSQSLSEGLNMIEVEFPELIIANDELSKDVDKKLHEKIDLLDESYDPDVFLINSHSPSELNHHPDNSRLLKEIEDFIRAFKSRVK